MYPVLREPPMIVENRLHLFLDYAESGWNIDYIMPLSKDGKYYIGCPAQAMVGLALWTPGDTEIAATSVRSLEDYYTFPIEEATTISLDEFYEQFQDPAQCLKTPINIWPQSAVE
jgi:hypothetical protein